MGRRSRFRRVAKWAGFGLCVLILAAWGVNLRYTAMLRVGSRMILVSKYSLICLALREHPASISKTLSFQAHEWWSPEVRWPGVSKMRGYVVLIDLPMWLLLLAAAVPTVILFHRDRRRIRPGHCRICGYNLTGNESGICSECGTKIGAVNVPGGDKRE